MKPLQLAHIHHIAIATSDLAACKAFYCDLMGFRDLPRPPFSFPGAWLYGYNVQIHIIQTAADSRSEKIDTRNDHIAFATIDIQQVKQTLQEAGIDFHEQVNAGGSHQIFFHDPDHHQIEVALYPNPDPSRGYGE